MEQQLFEQIHVIADCILKHLPTSHVLLFEGIEAAVQKGLDPSGLVEIHRQSVDLMRRTISLLIPDNECIAKIPELWQCVGWLNAAEEHMLDKYEEYTLRSKAEPQVKPLVESLLKIMHATRSVRRNLERELFRSLVSVSKG